MDPTLLTWLLYLGCVLGAIGIAIALPKKGANPQLLGGLLAATGLGAVFLALTLNGAIPNIHYYIFSFIALGAALRVITHPRPVYSALYFILTILACAGLYILLSAEFMSFALIIVYAGAILITYLFVIMLATQAPSEEELDVLPNYDRYAREPILAAGFGFVLLAVLLTVTSSSVTSLPTPAPRADHLAMFPGTVDRAFRDAGVLDSDETIATAQDGSPRYDADQGVIYVALKNNPDTPPMRRTRTETDNWPTNVGLGNTERIGVELLFAKPGMIEIAGVILLMAMLGAVVLARKKVELDEQAKLAAQRRHLDTPPSPEAQGAAG